MRGGIHVRIRRVMDFCRVVDRNFRIHRIMSFADIQKMPMRSRNLQGNPRNFKNGSREPLLPRAFRISEFAPGHSFTHFAPRRANLSMTPRRMPELPEHAARDSGLASAREASVRRLQRSLTISPSEP